MANLSRGRQRTALAVMLAACFILPAAAQDSFEDEPGLRADDPAILDAEHARLASQSLLLGVVRSSDGYVAVGERGHVLFSIDGNTWTQARTVPTRSTLTAVTQAGQQLWAVGHDGVIIHSVDRGDTWERQRVEPWVEGSFDPEAGVPLLDVLFLDEQHGMAIGAFSLLLETVDGGRTWSSQFLSDVASPATDAGAEVADTGSVEDDGLEDDGFEDDWGFTADDLALDAEDDPHLNAIARAGGGGLVIAGERGSVFRSRNDGDQWERLALPYEGSMFGALAWDDEHIMVFGLRGNVFESFDLGTTWQRLDTGTEASLMGGVALPGGGALLVGNEGRLVYRDSTGAPFRRATHINEDGETPVLSTAATRAGEGFIVLGERGIDTVAPAGLTE